MSRRRETGRNETAARALDRGYGSRWHWYSGEYTSAGIGAVDVPSAKRVGARLEREKRIYTRGGAIKVID